MAAVIPNLLHAEHVKLELAAGTRDEAVREIVTLLRGAEKVGDVAGFVAAVLAREKVQTTLLSGGVAFPHARTSLVSQIVLGIGRSRAGVPFGENGDRAHLIFVIGVPQRMVTDYLVCVGALARLVSGSETREQLMKAPTAAEFIDLLRKGSLVLE